MSTVCLHLYKVQKQKKGMSAVLSHDDYPWAERVVVTGKGRKGASWGVCVKEAGFVLHTWGCLLSENTLCYTPFVPFSVCLL